jgi:hypothetical protein
MRERRGRSERLRVRIPADVDRPDRLIGGLTGHQLALLAAAAAAVWLLYAVAHDVVPAPVIGAAAVPIIVAAVGLAIGRRDGLSLDRFLLAAVRHRRSQRLLVPAPSDVRPTPTWVGTDPGPIPAPLELPCREIDDDGLLDLGDDGAAIVCRARTIGFELRTEDEQAALVAAFGRYLNGLTTPVQIVVRSEPVDLQRRVKELRDEAGGLPHQELERAAVAHARFLHDLATTRTLLKRDVLLVLRDPAGGVDAATRIRVRAEDVVSGLAAAGVTVTVLDQTQARRCVEAAYDPAGVASLAQDREATW